MTDVYGYPHGEKGIWHDDDGERAAKLLLAAHVAVFLASRGVAETPREIHSAIPLYVRNLLIVVFSWSGSFETETVAGLIHRSECLLEELKEKSEKAASLV